MLGHTTKIHPKAVCLDEQAECHNLSQGIVVNRCVAKVKSRSMPVILITTTKQMSGQCNLCWLLSCIITQLKLQADMEVKGNIVNISFLPVVPNNHQAQVELVESTPTDILAPNPNEKPVFGPRPDIIILQILIFKAEVKCLPFKLNWVEEAKLTHIQQSWFIDLIYDHPEVFSLHDEDLRFCDWIKHTIPMTMDNPVYLAHCTIPPQLQGEVHKCLDTWL